MAIPAFNFFCYPSRGMNGAANVGENRPFLIRRRTAAGLDQKRLAQLAGIRAATISRIESRRPCVLCAPCG